MQSVQRRFGKFLPRTADESQVAVLLKDFDDADKMLAKVSAVETPIEHRMIDATPSDHRRVQSMARFMEGHTRNAATTRARLSDHVLAHHWCKRGILRPRARHYSREYNGKDVEATHGLRRPTDGFTGGSWHGGHEDHQARLGCQRLHTTIEEGH